jgi:hypothetical protein
MDQREQGLTTRDLAGGTTVDREEEAHRDAAVADEPTGTTGTATAERDADVADRDAHARARDADVPDRDADAATGADAPERSAEVRAPASTNEMAAGQRDESADLLPAEENAELQRRWEGLQTGFVDEPRRTVEQADQLVAEVMKRLAEGFAAERERLEQQWGRGEDISTEDLRVTLQRYRAFFQRLLSA